ncbi:diaminobutyrate--2-oxoglutarate transaminase family protein [Streptomyces sp. NBC_00459]|uniref:diaminobutyrate--2-oxoglutarate transaminase family protein n=1 Tax=Streptomyces sp. NBC_00459 TaxID=2975749 RepID=UPI002E18D373
MRPLTEVVRATPVPGPKGRALLERQEARESNARSYPRRLPIAVRRAQGPFIEDMDGNVFIDFLSGAGVLPLGHNHPELVDIARSQMAEFVHGLDFPTPAKDRFTERQLAHLPGAMGDRMKIHFCGPTGANAVEAAIKLCKTATGRSEIITFRGGFHGCTTGAMSVTGLLSQKNPVGNLMPGVHFLPYSNCSNCPMGLMRCTCEVNCATFLETALEDPNGGITRPAAVLMEIVQAEGGVIPADLEFVRRVRELTRRLDIPLIVDEIQTGCGRTGTWLAFEQYGIEPDVVLLSKALSGIGLPVSIVIFDERLDTWAPGAHTGTFRGNQLAFATGSALFDVFERDDILGNVERRGAELAAGLGKLGMRSTSVSDVRGLGLMWGIQFGHPGPGPAGGELARAVQAAALQRGLIVEVGGRDDAVIRLLPPLNITADLLHAALGILDAAVAEAERECSPTVPMTVA